MNKQEHKKKVWAKPAVNALSIKRDTFSTGSVPGPEGAGKSGEPVYKK